MSVIMIFDDRDEYFSKKRGNIRHRKGDSENKTASKKALKNILWDIGYIPPYISYYDMFVYGMDGKSVQPSYDFIIRCKDFIETKSKESDSAITEYDRVTNDRRADPYTWKDCACGTEAINMVDDLVNLFRGNIVKIKLPRNKTLKGNPFNVEVSLASGDYNIMHTWVTKNIKTINEYIKKLLIAKYGNTINAYHVIDLIHLRNGMILYTFELKPRLIKKIEEAVNK